MTARESPQNPINYMKSLNSAMFARPGFFRMEDGRYSKHGWSVINGILADDIFQIRFPDEPYGISDEADWMEILLTIDSVGLFRAVEAEFKERNIPSPEKLFGLLRHYNYGWMFPEELNGSRI